MEPAMHRPSIRMIRFYPDRFLELAVDEHADIPLLGIPFDIGGSGHTRYYRISRNDFDACASTRQPWIGWSGTACSSADQIISTGRTTRLTRCCSRAPDSSAPKGSQDHAGHKLYACAAIDGGSGAD